MNAARLVRATSWIAFANAAALGAQFLTTVLIARAFGTRAAMDAYTLAVSIPEALQYLLLLATLSIIFTPMFIDTRTTQGESEAWSIALSLLALIVLFVLFLIPLLALAMPWLMYALAPGFAPETRALAVELSQLILPGVVYYATAGILLGICFAYHDFTTAALNTILLALLNLLGFFVFVQWFQGDVRGLMLGRLCALAILQIFLVARVLRHKRGVVAPLRLFHPQVRTMLTYMPPYMFGAIAGQLQLVVTRSLISTLGAGSVAAWGYGQRLADIPMGVVGGALGTTFLPDFASVISSEDVSAARAQWARAVLWMTLLLAPLAALIVSLAAPLVELLLQRGAFDAEATQNSALILAGLVLGLPLRGVGGLIVRAMPVFKTRRLPVLLSALSVGASIVSALLLLAPLGLFGVALAISLGDALFAIVGALVFWKRLRMQEHDLLVSLVKIFVAAVCAGIACYASALVLQEASALVRVVVGGAVGALVFISTTLVLRVSEIRDAQHFLRRKLDAKIPSRSL